MERYAFENGDIQAISDPAVLDHVKQQGWSIREVMRDPVPSSLPRTEIGGRRTPDTPLVTICIPHYNLGRDLPETLESVAGQTYPALEVLVIDDGSTDEASRVVFEQMRQKYRQFRFIEQENAGIGATRNRGLREARGEYYLPVDADNILRPEMVERLVIAMQRRPELAAMTCYFLAFREAADIERENFLYACRPAGGPHLLSCLHNVYGDACALHRTEVFRSVGGYEVDRDTSWEDWEAFVKLANAGHRIDVLPEHLFYYRHLDTGFSRVTRQHANHRRILRQFARLDRLSPADQEQLRDFLVGMHLRIREQTAREESWRFRLVDGLYSLAGVGRLTRGLKGVLTRWRSGRSETPSAVR
jgi:glycosyltransferase involved in cell wall biosynthesis